MKLCPDSGQQWYGRMELPQQGAVNNINNGIEPAVQQVSLRLAWVELELYVAVVFGWGSDQCKGSMP